MAHEIASVTDSPNGVVLVDKPQGPSSHTVVAIARRLLGTRKIGHAGTLDPMATGLLVLGVGVSTRLLTFLVGADKTYTATIRLGAATVTDDAEGETVSTATPDALAVVTDDRISVEITTLTGIIQQRPSAVSAIKVDGERAYDRVRAGEEVELAAREVTVSRFEVQGTHRTETSIDLDVVVDCSSGTYIRALARDLGAALGVGGHLTALRRTRVGDFDVADACVPDDIEVSRLINAASVARAVMPAWELAAAEEVDLGHGKKVATATPDAPLVAAIHDDRLVAIVSVKSGVARVVTGFPRD